MGTKTCSSGRGWLEPVGVDCLLLRGGANAAAGVDPAAAQAVEAEASGGEAETNLGSQIQSPDEGSHRKPYEIEIKAIGPGQNRQPVMIPQNHSAAANRVCRPRVSHPEDWSIRLQEDRLHQADPIRMFQEERCGGSEVISTRPHW